MISLRNLGVLLVLGFFAMLGLWVSDKLTPVDSQIAVTSMKQPDYSMENFTITAMDVNGDPRYHLGAQFMFHYPHTDITELKKPNVILYEPHEAPWNMQANEGQYSGPKKEIRLEGEVRIDRDKSPRNREFSLEADSLVIYPDEQLFRTDSRILLKSEGSFLQAKGMIADLKNENVQLLSNVRGTYVTQAR